MSRVLFDALGQIHRFDDLEKLLGFACRTVESIGEWSTVLATFYLADQAYFGIVGCPPGTRERFQRSFATTTVESRDRKREQILRYVRPGTNICFVPHGEGPRPAAAFVPSQVSGGSWQSDDRLMIIMRGWNDEILGVLSLDNPVSGNRPDEDTYRRLDDVDHFINVVAKIAENRFWSLRVKESEEAYRGIFDAATDGFLIFDFKGRVVEANPAICRQHGYERDEIIGLDGIRLIHPDSQKDFRESLVEIRTGGRIHLEAKQVHKDGSVLDVEVRAGRLLFRRRPHVLAVVRDISERKRMFERLLHQQKEESIIALAGGVAHDFNNLLMGITGSLSLLRLRLPGDEEANRQCDRIGASADRLASLTGQLLAVAGGVQSETRPLAIGQVLLETRDLLQGVDRSRVGVVVDIEGGLWPVEADPVQLNQIFLNLGLNACEAIDGGGTLRMEAQNVTRPERWLCPFTGHHDAGEYVRVSVADDGTGMDEETRRRMFEPFYSTKSAGRGLGLAAVLGIVQRHNAAISVNSRSGLGTEIVLHLPRCRVDASPRPVGGIAEPSDPAGRRVLLVEDEPVVREVATEMLQTLGYEVVGADCGQRAIETYRSRGHEFDIVLLDVQMPTMSGIEVTAVLRELDPTVTIVLASGHTRARVEEELAGAGAVAGFIQKPYTLEGLGEILATAAEG